MINIIGDKYTFLAFLIFWPIEPILACIPCRDRLGLIIVGPNKNGLKWPDPFWPTARVGWAKMGRATLFPISNTHIT